MAICRELAPQTPCMLVTGSLSLEQAASSMDGGVVDCFSTDDLLHGDPAERTPAVIEVAAPIVQSVADVTMSDAVEVPALPVG